MAGTHRRSGSVEKTASPFAVPYPRNRAGSIGGRDRSKPPPNPLVEVAGNFVNSPSPLKRSDALPNLLNLDQTLPGSPSVARSRRCHNLRKNPSVDNFTGPGHRDSPFGTPHANTNPSIHPFHQRNQARLPHPLSRGSVTSGSARQNVSSDTTSTKRTSSSLPSSSEAPIAAIESFKLDLGTGDNHFSTPDAFRGVKPLATAFMSTGLLSKRNRPLEHLKIGKPTPDTPCKRPTMIGLPTTPGTPGTPLGNLGAKDFLGEHHGQGKSHAMDIHEDNALDEYLFLDNEGDSSFIYASSSSDFDGTPHTPTRSLFSLSNGSSTTDRKRRKPLLFGRSPADDDDSNYFVTSMGGTPASNAKIAPSTATTTTVERRPRTMSSLESTAGFGSSQVTIKDAAQAVASMLETRFRNVEKIGSGEFSDVYVVEDRASSVKYAVKRVRTSYNTAKERARRHEEVEILQQIGKHEHIIELHDSWEEAGHLFLQTEYCENGSLDVFLQDLGRTQRLDEFRVWKVLTELALGLSFIHDKGFLHLDLKPANIFITFEGVLKIGDFGMSVQYPAPAHIEREGDREYIAPEVLSSGKYDKPVDIFSLGLIILEIAANIVLPDNGTSWQKLRSGDLSDAPKLSSSDEASTPQSVHDQVVTPHRYIGQGGLDRVVRWMLMPDPTERPTVNAVLNIEEVQWANRVRRAGAVIYEGDRGPSAQAEYDIYMVNEESNMEDDGEDWRMEM